MKNVPTCVSHIFNFKISCELIQRHRNLKRDSQSVSGSEYKITHKYANSMAPFLFCFAIIKIKYFINKWQLYLVS